ncbi:MAG: hypothetical protein ACRC22_07985, partial [Shewanella sp.]
NPRDTQVLTNPKWNGCVGRFRTRLACGSVMVDGQWSIEIGLALRRYQLDGYHTNVIGLSVGYHF